jgi:hypothetical protein
MGEADSAWTQYERNMEFYAWCKARGMYIHAYGARFSRLDSAVLGFAGLGCGCRTVRVFILDSAVLGLAGLGCDCRTVRVFPSAIHTLKDAIECHAFAPLEAQP